MEIRTICKQTLIYLFLPALFLAAGAVSGIAYERYWHREECLKMAYDNSGEPNLSDQEIDDILKTLNSGEEGSSSGVDQVEMYNDKLKEGADEPQQDFVGSKNSNKFYAVDCRYAKLIKEENKVYFASREEGEKQGRTYKECN